MVNDVQFFIGFAKFYQCFIEGFSRVCKLIIDSLHNGGKEFKWTDACTKTFKQLKEMFTTAPILRHFNPSLQPIMETDDSDFAIGAVLSQIFEDGQLHPTAFFTKKLQPAEMNYEIHGKNCWLL